MWYHWHPKREAEMQEEDGEDEGGMEKRKGEKEGKESKEHFRLSAL